MDIPNYVYNATIDDANAQNQSWTLASEEVNAREGEYSLLSLIEEDEYPYMHNILINETVEEFSALHEAQSIIRNYITPTICILGFLGNAFNIIVLSRLRLLRNDGARDSGTNLGLLVLAVSDMLFCLSMFPRCFVPESSSLFEKKNFRWFYQVSLFNNVSRASLMPASTSNLNSIRIVFFQSQSKNLLFSNFCQKPYEMKI